MKRSELIERLQEVVDPDEPDPEVLVWTKTGWLPVGEVVSCHYWSLSRGTHGVINLYLREWEPGQCST
jgi:hypothetical protein